MVKHMARGAWLQAGIVLAALPLLAGCVSHLARYTVHVKLSESVADTMGVLPNVETHLIAANAVDGARLMRMPMSVYWDPNRPPDYLVRRTMLLGGQHSGEETLAQTDTIWRRWDGDHATELVVLADLPGTYDERPAMNDPRRLVIPLARTLRWFRPRRQIWILIDKSIHDVTPRDDDADIRGYRPYDRHNARPSAQNAQAAGSTWNSSQQTWTPPPAR